MERRYVSHVAEQFNKFSEKHTPEALVVAGTRDAKLDGLIARSGSSVPKAASHKSVAACCRLIEHWLRNGLSVVTACIRLTFAPRAKDTQHFKL